MSEPFGMTIFCDDIRQEVSGKFTYIGVYMGDLIINSPKPAIMPMMSFAISLNIPAETKYSSLKFVVTLKTENDLVELVSIREDIPKHKNPIGPNTTWVAIRSHLTVSPLQLIDDGRLFVRAYIDDEEQKLGSLDVKFIPPENSSPITPSS